MEKISSESRIGVPERLYFKNACILCKGDLGGDEAVGLRCQTCNIRYSIEDLFVKIPNFIKENGVRRFR